MAYISSNGPGRMWDFVTSQVLTRCIHLVEGCRHLSPRSVEISTTTWIALNVQTSPILSLVIFCFSSKISPWGNLSCSKKKCQWRRASCASNRGRSKQLIGKFLNCMHLINHWPEITCLATAQKHYKKRDFRKAKPFSPFHQHVHKPLTDKSDDFQCVRLPHGINKYVHFRARSSSRTCTSGHKCTVAAARERFLDV